MTKLLLVLGLVGLYSCCAVAIKCIACTTYANYAECQDGDEGREVDCPSNLDYASCKKQIKADGTVSRGCDKGNIAEEVCRDSENNVMECWCNTDYCNGGSTTNINLGVPILSFFVAGILAKMM